MSRTSHLISTYIWWCLFISTNLNTIEPTAPNGILNVPQTHTHTCGLVEWNGIAITVLQQDQYMP